MSLKSSLSAGLVRSKPRVPNDPRDPGTASHTMHLIHMPSNSYIWLYHITNSHVTTNAVSTYKLHNSFNITSS